MKFYSHYFCFLWLSAITQNIFAQEGIRETYVNDLREADWYYHKKNDKNKVYLNNRWPEYYMGTVHILNPLKEFNADSLKWIENTEWEYSTTIKASGKKHENYTLVAEEIEPFSEIYLNGEKIGTSENYFLKNNFTITGKFIAERVNELKIVVPSAVQKAKEKYAGEKIIYPSDDDISKTRQYIRKPAFQFGWDIAPRLLIPHLSKNVKITGWDDFIIYQHYIRQEKINEKEARLSVYFELESDERQNLKISYTTKKGTVEVVRKLKKGRQTIVLPVIIPEPKLWWPNGLHQLIDPHPILQHPHLTMLEFNFSTKNQKERRRIQTGLRKIELVRKTDKKGESFFFRVNGRKVFIKGANIVPIIDPIASTSDILLYRFQSSNIPLQNFNMIRIWGGGEYMSEEFYDYCDQSGIFVWHDFMFANTMYPSDAEFLKNVKAEAEYQVKRLSHHPCIALWCGNNEIEVAWKNWGWQGKYGYTESQVKEMEKGYEIIFKNILPLAVKEFSNTNYLSSSPVSNWGNPDDFTKGDNHYWGVWHGEHMLELFNSRIPRFMSEYGFPSFPDVESIKGYIENEVEKWDENSPAFQNRMKSYKGIKLIGEYINHEYGKPENTSAFIFLSQVIQSDAYKKAIEAQRRAKPYCMGTMFWQLNDTWPGITWSTIDYSGKFKPAHYEIIRAYQPLIISPTEENGKLNIYVVSDFINDTTIDIEFKLMDFYGKPIEELKKEVKIFADTSMIIFSIDSEILLKGQEKNKILLYCRAYKEAPKYHRASSHDNIYYFVKPKDLVLPDPPVIKKFDDTYSFTSPVLIKNIDFTFYVYRNKKTVKSADILPGDRVLLYEESVIGERSGMSLFNLVERDSIKK